MRELKQDVIPQPYRMDDKGFITKLVELVEKYRMEKDEDW